jgi:predicted RNA-binding protein associated with RNAse of E/G family
MAMITVNKLNPLGEKTIQYQGEVLERLTDEIIIQAYWNHSPKDLGYVCFEPGDRFIEYYYVNRWFNIFEISDASNERKGWYCNIAEPADIREDQILQKDLLLEVWVDPSGKPLVLDEDEFEADRTLDDRQRQGAHQGLRDLLQIIANEAAPFSYKPFKAQKDIA